MRLLFAELLAPPAVSPQTSGVDEMPKNLPRMNEKNDDASTAGVTEAPLGEVLRSRDPPLHGSF